MNDIACSADSNAQQVTWRMALVLLAVLIQELHGFFRWEDEQFNFAPLSLTFDLIHNW